MFKANLAMGLMLVVFLNLVLPLAAQAQILQPTGFLSDCRPPRDASGNVTSGTISIAVCVNQIYMLSLGLGGLLALFMLVISGYRYMTSGGNAQQVESAKDTFTSALTGLIVLLIGFILLNVINPDLTNLRDFNLDTRLPLSF